MASAEGLAGNLHNNFYEVIDGSHLLRPNIDRPRKVRVHQSAHAFDTVVDVEERASLLAVTPDLNLTTGTGLSDLAADSRGSLFPTALPCPFRAKDIVKTCDANLDTKVPGIGKIEALAEQLFPSIFAVRCSRIGRSFRADRVCWIHLIAFRVNARR